MVCAIAETKRRYQQTEQQTETVAKLGQNPPVGVYQKQPVMVMREHDPAPREID